MPYAPVVLPFSGMILVAFLLFQIRQHLLRSPGQQWLIYLLIVYCLLLIAMSFLGAFSIPIGVMDPVLLLISVPFALGVLYVFRKKSNTFLSNLNPVWLIRIQSVRVLTELLFLLGYVTENLPFQMTLLGFNYDMVVGISAIIAARLFFMRNRIQFLHLALWNFFGLMVLTNVVVLYAMSAPGPFRIFLNEPSASAFATPLYILVPGFIIPFCLIVHLFSLKRTWLQAKESRHQ